MVRRLWRGQRRRPGLNGRRTRPADGDPLGVYLAVPFCRAKCSFCNFSSGVFPPAVVARYLAALRRELALSLEALAAAGPPAADSVYLGGGTPTLLPAQDLLALMAALRQAFAIAPGAEITCEAMPGTVCGAICAALAETGVSRVSLGVQTWSPAEAGRLGRRQTPEAIHADVERLRRAGIASLNLDLIAGLPGQTEATWRDSVRQTVATGVPHVSIYLFELDQDSRLGKEILAGGRRYHAAEMPDPDATADWYEWAIETLAAAGIEQYEISNFARPGFESRHNQRYWLRRPYLGFGLDAHSFLRQPVQRRWGNSGGMSEYLGQLAAGRLPRCEDGRVEPRQALEEALFLGLRRNAGVEWRGLEREFGQEAVASKRETAAELSGHGWLRDDGQRVALTPQGRLLSNEVFARFIA